MKNIKKNNHYFIYIYYYSLIKLLKNYFHKFFSMYKNSYILTINIFI